MAGSGGRELVVNNEHFAGVDVCVAGTVCQARGVQPVIIVKAEHLTVFIQHSDISNSREHTGRVYIHYILHIMSQCEKMMTSLLIRQWGERDK